MPQTKRKKPAAAPRIPRALRSLLTALQGAPFKGTIARPQTLLTSLMSIRSMQDLKPQGGLAVPITADIHTTCGEIQGKDCAKEVRITAGYLNWLGPLDNPLGEAAVTALLNLAASQRCVDELQCPGNSPASFKQQKKLFDYHFFAGVGGKNSYESGILTIPESEFNCRCQEPVTN